LWHGGVHLPGKLDKAGVQPVFPGLPD